MNILNAVMVWFSQQQRSLRLMIAGIGLLLLLGACGLFGLLFIKPAQHSLEITATYDATTNGALVTWIPLITDTPTPTSSPTPTFTPVPTRTPLPTGLPTQSFDTPTVVILLTNFLSIGNADTLVVITAVDKKLEYVDIQNTGGAPISLSGWVLVSEVGNQSCVLRGILQSKEVLRVWAGTAPVGTIGISCGFKNSIWLDQELDPAVLYNAKGQEVSRYPKP